MIEKPLYENGGSWIPGYGCSGRADGGRWWLERSRQVAGKIQANGWKEGQRGLTDGGSGEAPGWGGGLGDSLQRELSVLR